MKKVRQWSSRSLQTSRRGDRRLTQHQKGRRRLRHISRHAKRRGRSKGRRHIEHTAGGEKSDRGKELHDSLES